MCDVHDCCSFTLPATKCSCPTTRTTFYTIGLKVQPTHTCAACLLSGSCCISIYLSPAGELAFWAPPDTHVVTYSGSVAARSILAEHELWLQPTSLDGKLGSGSAAGAPGRAALAARVPKPHVVLTTYEVVCSDVHVLAGLPWASIVVDRRQRSRSAAGKAQAALQELAAGHRVVLSCHGLRAAPEALFTLLSFVKPGSAEAISDVVPAYAVEPEQQVRSTVCAKVCVVVCVFGKCRQLALLVVPAYAVEPEQQGRVWCSGLRHVCACMFG